MKLVEPVTTPLSLERIAGAARATGQLALDTEFMRERTYRARLCLVQVAVDSSIEVIDALEVDLAPLAALLGDPDTEIVIHAGKQDLDIFNDLYGVVPRNVFDVQVAAGFAGYGASLPYGRLVELLLGVSLVKGESYTDWCRRPLTGSQLTYAADDVRYLLPVAARLKDELRSRGRLRWVADEMASLEDADAYGVAADAAWRKVAGRGALNSRQLAVLKEVAAWREDTAARRDIPRGWVIKDPTLIDIARRQPSKLEQLAAIRGINAKEADRSGRAILSAVDRGRRAAPLEPAAPAPPREVLARARMTAALADALVRSRCERAGIATELVATRGELEAVLTSVFCGNLEARRHRLLQGWRRELAGDALLALAEGSVALRATRDPPYVEEVPVPWPTRNG